MAQALGPDKCRGLPAFHAFTGCDTVSSFGGRSKKTAWETWKVTADLPSPSEWGWMKSDTGWDVCWTTGGNKNMPETYQMRLQEGMQRTMQVQEGCTSVHGTMPLRRTVCSGLELAVSTHFHSGSSG